MEPVEILAPTPQPVRRSLSPSRAGDFQTCPLLYRFRTIDRLPEPADPVMVRGSLVHAVLEELFGEAAPGRTLDRAAELLPHEWARLRESEPRLAELFGADDAAAETVWLASAIDLLTTYFRMEDPRWIEPAAREERIAYAPDDTVTFGGIVDRLDIAPDGRIRVVDYKTGRSPDPRFEDKAMFQMRFYALVLWRARGVLPTLLQLMYLGDGSILTYEPDGQELIATERKLVALWSAIERAIEQRDFPARRSSLCGWCRHRDICPAWGGTPPDMPELELVSVTDEPTVR